MHKNMYTAEIGFTEIGKEKDRILIYVRDIHKEEKPFWHEKDKANSLLEKFLKLKYEGKSEEEFAVDVKNFVEEYGAPCYQSHNYDNEIYGLYFSAENAKEIEHFREIIVSPLLVRQFLFMLKRIKELGIVQLPKIALNAPKIFSYIMEITCSEIIYLHITELEENSNYGADGLLLISKTFWENVGDKLGYCGARKVLLPYKWKDVRTFMEKAGNDTITELFIDAVKKTLQKIKKDIDSLRAFKINDGVGEYQRNKRGREKQRNHKFPDIEEGTADISAINHIVELEKKQRQRQLLQMICDNEGKFSLAYEDYILYSEAGKLNIKDEIIRDGAYLVVEEYLSVLIWNYKQIFGAKNGEYSLWWDLDTQGGILYSLIYTLIERKNLSRCPSCNELFFPKRKKQRCCCHKCSDRYYHKNKRL